MAGMTDYMIDIVKNSNTATASADNALATATVAAVGDATGPGRRHIVVTKVDASYSSSTISGLLRIFFGATVVGEKYMHAAGAVDFGVFGLQNPTPAQAVSATLAASGSAGALGKIVLTYYVTGPNE